MFRKSKEEILQIAVEGAKLLQQLTEEAGADYRFEYSPESFTGTEPEYALEVCNAVLEVWKPTADRKAIINLPVIVILGNTALKCLDDYLAQKKEGKNPCFKAESIGLEGKTEFWN